MRFLDLFAGIGGIRLGMEQAGHSCIGWVEWDKFARKSYKAIHDTEGEYEGHDIKSVTGSELPTADIWAFGSPCTNISIAGNRAGLGGEQSSMFFEVMRLLREIDGKEKPKYLFMENVKNLLSSNRGWDFARVIFEMDEIGYDVEWDVLDSAEVVPQHRERIFIVGHLRGRRTRKVFPITRKGEPTSDERQKINIVGTTKPASSTRFGQRDVVYDSNGLMGTLGATDYKQPKQIALCGGGQEPKILEDYRIRKLTPRETWRLQGFPDWAFDKAQEAGLSDSQLYKQAGNSVTVPVIKAIAEKMEMEDKHE